MTERMVGPYRVLEKLGGKDPRVFAQAFTANDDGEVSPKPRPRRGTVRR